MTGKESASNRCGHCGRSFTSAQWRRHGLWCPGCRKFLCRECVGTGMLCPACATKMGFDVSKLFFVAFLTGSMFMFVGVISVLQNTYTFQEMPEYPLVMLGMPGAFMAIGLIALYLVLKRKRLHRRFISDMPQGVIPVQLRPGYSDPEVRRRWAEANISHSMRGGILKGSWFDIKFQGLEGRWDFPVVSPEERREWTEKATKDSLKAVPVFISIGVVLAIVNVYFYNAMILYVFASTSVIVGVLIFLVVRFSKDVVSKDGEFEVNAYWKTVGYDATARSIEAFLEKRGDRYVKSDKEWPMWKNPEHRFTFENGAYIKSMYEERSDGHVYGWVTIVYKQSRYEFAQKLQQDLDDFLLMHDLIERQLVF